jgi:hypothetical protein
MIEFLLIISFLVSGANADVKKAKKPIAKISGLPVCKQKMNGNARHDIHLRRIQAVLNCPVIK